MNKKISLAVFIIMAAASLTACNNLDIIGDTSVKAFDKLLDLNEDRVNDEEADSNWSLTSPDGDVKFLWSKDYSKTSPYDVELVVNIQPFIDAGLDISKLPEGMVADNQLIVGNDFGSNVITYDGEITPLKSYEQIVKLNRRSIKYHTALDHFGIDLANGNMFEWAKDTTINDKDMVFVLAPQVLIDAGVDPAKVKGWVFAKVPVMDAKGRKTEVEKFLKPFNLDDLPKK